MNIQDKFESLSSFQKLELYIIVIIFFFILFYFKDMFVFKINPNNNPSHNIKSLYEKKIELLNSSFSSISNNKIVNIIYKKADSFNIKLEKFKNDKKSLILEFSSTFENIFLFFTYLNQHFIVKNFQVKKEEVYLKTKLILDKRYFFEKTKNMDFKTIVDPFFSKTINVKKEKNIKSKLLVKAIILDYLYINDKWYKVGDSIDQYIIKGVKNNKAIVYDKEKKISVFYEVFKDE